MRKGRHVDSLIERERAGGWEGRGGGKGSTIFGIALGRFAPVGVWAAENPAVLYRHPQSSCLSFGSRAEGDSQMFTPGANRLGLQHPGRWDSFSMHWFVERGHFSAEPCAS